MLLSEFKEKFPKLILRFEKSGKYTIWNNKLTHKFIDWIRQNIKYKDLICNNPYCSKFGKKFYSKRALITHKQWHDKEYRENISKKIKEVWNKKRGYMFGRTGDKHPNYGKRGKDNPNWDKNGLHYNYTHLKAHEDDPKPEDGICAYCHNVADKKGITKLVHSNKDHSYRLPINPDEWQWIHHSCHMKYDSENKVFIKKLKEKIIS